MASDEKLLNRLGGVEKYVYRKAKSSFEKHAKNCEHQYIGPNGERRCSHPKSGAECRFEACPLIQDREGKE